MACIFHPHVRYLYYLYYSSVGLVVACALNFLRRVDRVFPLVNLLINEGAHPRPTASMWEMIRDGRKSLRKSADRTPPFFITLVFLMLREVERLGYLSRSSLQRTWIFHQCGFIEISAGLMSLRHRCDRSVIWHQANWLILICRRNSQHFCKMLFFKAVQYFKTANWGLMTSFSFILVYLLTWGRFVGWQAGLAVIRG